MNTDTTADSPDDARKFGGAQKAAAILLAMTRAWLAGRAGAAR